MKKVCEYQGYYIDYDEETGEEDVLKCKLFTNEGEWDEYCYCDEEERNNCMLYKYSKYIEDKDKEIERLNNIINKLEEYFKKYDEIMDTNFLGVLKHIIAFMDIENIDKEIKNG